MHQYWAPPPQLVHELEQFPVFEVAEHEPAPTKPVELSILTLQVGWLQFAQQTALVLTAGPGDPCGPVAPVAPVAPVDPVDPCGPVDPVEPVNPCGPVDPVAPTAPVAPVAPVDPCGPVGPV